MMHHCTQARFERADDRHNIIFVVMFSVERSEGLFLKRHGDGDGFFVISISTAVNYVVVTNSDYELTNLC